MPVQCETKLLARSDAVVVRVGHPYGARARRAVVFERRAMVRVWGCGRRIETGNFVGVDLVEEVVAVAVDLGGDVLMGETENGEPGGKKGEDVREGVSSGDELPKRRQRTKRG
jgi:hypothetical protein